MEVSYHHNIFEVILRDAIRFYQRIGLIGRNQYQEKKLPSMKTLKCSVYHESCCCVVLSLVI